MEILKIQQKEQLLIDFLRDKAFKIAKNTKYDVYQRGLASMVYKKYEGSGVNTHANKSAFNNEKLAEELRKTIIKIF